MKNKLIIGFMSLAMAITAVATPIGENISGVFDSVSISANAEISDDFEDESVWDFDFEELDDGTAEITAYTGSATELTIPATLYGKKVTSIGDYAFYKCDSVVNITIPNGVKSIGDNTFFNCQNLKKISISDSVKSIGESAFFYCNNLAEVKLGKNITNIGDSAFFNCTSLTNITIPNSVTSIGYATFEECHNLISVTIPNSVTTIGEAAFWNCESLTNITIPNSVTNIEYGAFGGCTSLTSISIPSNATSINNDAFEYCSSLTDINVDSNNKNYSSQDGIFFNKNKTELIQYPIGNLRASYTVPNSVTNIRNNAFEHCSNLKNITISNNVKSIGESSFESCDNLTNVTIENGVTSIGDCAFMNCTNLVSITIPNSVKSIGNSAFRFCYRLKNVTIPNNGVNIGEIAFLDCLNLKNVVIPKTAKIDNCAFGYFNTVFDEQGRPTGGGGIWKDDNFPFKIQCYSGSAGEKYAIDNGFDYELLDQPTHTHKYTSKVTKQPTCTSTGVKTFSCSCGDRYTETIAKVAHKYSTSWTTDKIATCSSEGSKSHHCAVCGAKNDITVIPKIDHKYTTTVVVPTCIAKGYTEHKCSACGTSYKDNETAITSHKYSNWTTTKSATCTVTGTQERACSVCGKTETKTIAKISHSYKATVVKPTYSAQGYTLHKCSVCGANYKDNYKAKLTLANITKANLKSSANAVKMSWNKVSGATGYRVYKYNTSTKKWQTVANIKGTSYTFSKLKSGTTYKFTVRAYKTVSGKTYLSPKYKTFTSSTNPATVSFKVTGGSKKTTVKWNKVTGATGYKVYYKTSKNGKWIGLKTTNNKTTSYTKTGLKKGKTYYFTVKAYRKVGNTTYNGAFTTKSVKVK